MSNNTTTYLMIGIEIPNNRLEANNIEPHDEKWEPNIEGRPGVLCTFVPTEKSLFVGKVIATIQEDDDIIHHVKETSLDAAKVDKWLNRNLKWLGNTAHLMLFTAREF